MRALEAPKTNNGCHRLTSTSGALRQQMDLNHITLRPWPVAA
jgi:hypothetical protein